MDHKIAKVPDAKDRESGSAVIDNRNGSDGLTNDVGDCHQRKPTHLIILQQSSASDLRSRTWTNYLQLLTAATPLNVDIYVGLEHRSLMS